jgi:hypothetical protein
MDKEYALEVNFYRVIVSAVSDATPSYMLLEVILL